MPGTIQLIQVSKTPVRIQSFLISNDTVMLVNPDITNNIFVGNDPGSQLVAVPALGSITLDTKAHDLWVSTNGGAFTVNAYLLPNGSGWVPSPAQVAAQINALGLAKDTTVNSVVTNTTGVAKDSTVSTVATNTTGVAKDSTLATTNTNTANTATNVNTVNTTLGTPTQRVDVQNLTTGGNPGGIPVLRGTDNLGTASAQNLSANVTTTLLTTVTVTKPSFEAVLKLNAPAASGTIPFAVVNLQWTDSNTGLQVGAKSYVITAGNGPSNALTFYISGPCRGNQITLNISNRDPSVAFTLTWAFNQTSHIYTIDRMLQATYISSPNGFTSPAGNPAKGLLFAAQPTLLASGNVARLCAASNAKCKVNIDNGAQANGCAVTFTTPSSTGLYDESVTGQSLFRLVAAAGAQANQEWQMPNGPVIVTIINQGSTNSITPSVTITSMEY